MCDRSGLRYTGVCASGALGDPHRGTGLARQRSAAAHFAIHCDAQREIAVEESVSALMLRPELRVHWVAFEHDVHAAFAQALRERGAET